MARPRNPRREALGLLAAVKRTASAIASRWNVESVVRESDIKIDGNGREYYGNAIPRQRRPEEYPENSAHEWKILFAYADSMEESAANLKAMALAKWQEIEGTTDGLERVR
jgi:hypothetical protein